MVNAVAKKRKEKFDLYTALTSIRFTVKGKTYEIDIGSELLVGEQDHHSQVERLPAVMGYFGSIVSLLEQEYRDKKSLFERVEARLDKLIRHSGVMGEARVTSAIKRHSRWLEASLAVNKAKRNVMNAKYQLNSLREKSITLLSRSADLRATPSDSIMGVRREDVIRMGNYGDLKEEDSEEEV